MFPRRQGFAAALVWATLVASFMLGGCASGDMQYIPDGDTYTLAEAQDLANAADTAGVRDLGPDEARQERQDRLARLRGEGEEARALADVLTTQLPADSAAVPLRIEAAVVDESDVWIVVEAWGDDDGSLEHRRLWLFDRQTLQLVGSASFR
ncbi:MAG: hypothetical protein Kow0067_17960 [Coriobacteriia bacterium]